MAAFSAGRMSGDTLDILYDRALRETIERFEATGSPVISDGEQTKPSFVTYPIAGAQHLAPDGVTIEFADGHTRRLPRLTSGPFRYGTYADTYLVAARTYARVRSGSATSTSSATYRVSMCR